MARRTREEAIRAIAETVEEIGPQLREYISSRDNYNEFFDVAFDKTNYYNTIIRYARLIKIM